MLSLVSPLLGIQFLAHNSLRYPVYSSLVDHRGQTRPENMTKHLGR